MMIYRYLKDFISLFFPHLCNACGTALVGYEKLICTSCIYQLPYTNYHLYTDNKLMRQFWGRVKIESACAFLFFRQGGKVQRLMHQLKYNNVPEIGIELGRKYGKELIKQDHFQNITAIIPVPIHPKKRKIRGYNQSEQIAIGLSESMGIPVYNNILKRIKNTTSQTTVNKALRHDNLNDSFIAIGSDIELANVILVDDTITTGATLETCISALNKVNIRKINIVGIAYAQ